MHTKLYTQCGRDGIFVLLSCYASHSLHTSRLYNKLEGGDNWQLELLFNSDCLLELLKLMVQAMSLQPSS